MDTASIHCCHANCASVQWTHTHTHTHTRTHTQWHMVSFVYAAEWTVRLWEATESFYSVMFPGRVRLWWALGWLYWGEMRPCPERTTLMWTNQGLLCQHVVRTQRHLFVYSTKQDRLPLCVCVCVCACSSVLWCGDRMETASRRKGYRINSCSNQ